MATTAAILDIVIEQGTTWEDTFAAYDANSSPIDLTLATISFVISERVGSSALLTLSNSNGIVITDAANGEFEVTITTAQTTALNIEDDIGFYYCTVTISGEVQRILNGRIILNR